MIEKATASAVVVLALLAARLVMALAVRRGRWPAGDDGRRWLVLARNTTLLVGAMAVAMIWAAELRVIGLSLVAVAVALVISLQEVIRSVVASFVRATTGQFTIGDRVVIGGVRGYVIDHSLVQTTMLEIGPGHVRTGRTVSVPNGLLLTAPVVNETAGHRYILHSFVVPVPSSRWRDAMTVLEDAAVDSSRSYAAEAKAAMEERATRHSLPLPITEPLVFSHPDGESVRVTVRVPVLAADAGRVERQITHRWLDELHPDPGPAGGC